MTNENYEILLQNIEMLMRKENMIAADLIRDTGIAQSQVSKAMNRNEKTQFTFEQIWKIADRFKVSIDFLVGRKPEQATNEPLSNKEICKVLIQLIESEVITRADLSIEEHMYVEFEGPNNFGYPYEYRKEENPYIMFYFSNYINPDVTGCSQEQLDELEFDCQTQGNFNEKSKEINDFLDYYFKFYDLYKHNNLPRELFEQAIADRLDKMTK